MPSFSAFDGTTLAYRSVGDGAPLVCLPGGPMRAAEYLGDLGGLHRHRRLIALDLRGTGSSGAPADRSGYRCDRQVEDVEALRLHLGLDRMDVLGHSAGANLAVRYLSRHRDRVGRLALITPSVMALGVAVPTSVRTALAASREDEPWFAAAHAALEAIVAGTATEEAWNRIGPFYYGRWDDAAREHHASEESQRNATAADAFASDGAFDPNTDRIAVAGFPRRVLVLAGDRDLAAPPGPLAEYADLFATAEFVVQTGAGHYPWMDDAERFTASVVKFLDEA